MTQFGTFVARVSEEKIHMLTLFNTCMTTASTLFHTEKKAATDRNKTEVENAKAIQTKADGELVSTLDSLMQENTKSVDAKATEMKEMCLHEIVPEDLHEIVPEDLHEIVPEDPHESVPPEDPPVDSDQNCNAILSRNAAEHCNRLTVGEWCFENTKSTAIATVATKNTRSVPARAFIMPSITLFELLPNVRDLLPKIAADAGDLPELRLPHFQLGQYPLLNVSGLTLASVADIKLPGIPLRDFPGIALPVGSPFAELELPSITVANYPRIATIGLIQSNCDTPLPQTNGNPPVVAAAQVQQPQNMADSTPPVVAAAVVQQPQNMAAAGTNGNNEHNEHNEHNGNNGNNGNNGKTDASSSSPFNGSFYVGETEGLSQRLEQHRAKPG
jgi:hypothetical protein